MAKIGVILAGCGVYDGAEVHESVLTLLYLSQANQEVVAMAPNMEQHHVLNHGTGEEMTEKRNVLVEATRIARGPVLDISDANPADYDAIIIPGGFGAAKNLCTFALEGPEGKVQEDVARFLTGFHKTGKPIGALCIAPAILALLSSEMEGKPKITIGTDEATAAGINSLGCDHQNRSVEEICIDENLNLVTTPAYMLGQNIAEVAIGIEKLVSEVIARTR